MTPRKKDRIETPETITSPVEEDCNICSEAEESCCPGSSVTEENKDTSC